MKISTNVLSSIIFTTLILGFIQYASADHSLGDQGIFKDEQRVNQASTTDSKWLTHLQIVVRDSQGQLVSVTETTHGSYIPHETSDYIFDEHLGKKEIVNIDKITYERAQKIQTENVQQFPFPISYQDMQSFWGLEYCLKTKEHGNAQGISCMSVFSVTTPAVSLEETDTFTLHWTVLRES